MCSIIYCNLLLLLLNSVATKFWIRLIRFERGLRFREPSTANGPKAMELNHIFVTVGTTKFKKLIDKLQDQSLVDVSVHFWSSYQS